MNTLPNASKPNKGLSLLEIMIAVTILSLVVVGAVSVFIAGNNISTGAFDENDLMVHAQIFVNQLSEDMRKSHRGRIVISGSSQVEMQPVVGWDTSTSPASPILGDTIRYQYDAARQVIDYFVNNNLQNTFYNVSGFLISTDVANPNLYHLVVTLSKPGAGGPSYNIEKRIFAFAYSTN
ncbi:MAG: prepilin-type N-terminal cleavage/methylation domain-containing protein [Planctomycetota bacterium]|nr:MAG: prepilin-type N-terminal cleavage/methylation domain-containing protein [Planctomycetota bacterium]